MLLCIHINLQGQISVDVFSEKHAGFHKWRTYFSASPSTINRLRGFYLKHRKECYVTREWSISRWRAYKTWRASRFGVEWGERSELSLDLLPTKVPA